MAAMAAISVIAVAITSGVIGGITLMKALIAAASPTMPVSLPLRMPKSPPCGLGVSTVIPAAA